MDLGVAVLRSLEASVKDLREVAYGPQGLAAPILLP